MQTRETAKALLEKHAESNFVYFLAGLLALLGFIPIIDLLSSGRRAVILLLLLLSGTLVIASWTLRVNRRQFLAGVSLAATALLLAAAVTQSLALGYCSLMANIAFWSLGTWIACGHVLAGGPVTLNRIVGSICIYMMVAVVFAFLNVLVNWLLPGSFSNLKASGFAEELPEFIYYSYVTLNTLGYGDISPVGSLARILAIVESTFGVFYIAILVASLVGIGVSNQRSSSGKRPREASAASQADETHPPQ